MEQESNRQKAMDGRLHPAVDGQNLGEGEGEVLLSDRQTNRQTYRQTDSWLVACLLNVPATCKCISRTDLLRHFTCCHTDVEAADTIFYLNQSQYTDTGPMSPSTVPITPGAWQGSHWSAIF